MRWNPAQREVRTSCVPLAMLLCIWVWLPAPSADAAASKHPNYDDGGTLRWYTNLDEARRTARQEKRLLLVEVSVAGSRPCANVIGLIGDPAIRGRIAPLAVGHPVDARRGSPLVPTLRANLPTGTHLPWLGFVTPEGTWVSGFGPSRRTTITELRRRFLAALQAAESTQKTLYGATARTPAAPRTSSTRETAEGNEIPKPHTSSTRTEQKPAGRGTTASKGPSSPSALHWYRDIREAQAAARAQNKIILVTSTKPSCSLCKKLRNDVVPQVWREMSAGCILYVYDILQPEDRSVDRLVRRNLPNARLMPLSGFMTHDKRWLQGFFGATDARQLLGDYRSALRRR